MPVSWFMENIRSSKKYEYSRQSQQFFAAKCFGSCIKSRDLSDKVPKNRCCVRLCLHVDMLK